MEPSQGSGQTDLDTELHNVDTGLNLPSLQTTGLGESRYFEGETTVDIRYTLIFHYER